MLRFTLCQFHSVIVGGRGCFTDWSLSFYQGYVIKQNCYGENRSATGSLETQSIQPGAASQIPGQALHSSAPDYTGFRRSRGCASGRRGTIRDRRLQVSCRNKLIYVLVTTARRRTSWEKFL